MIKTQKWQFGIIALNTFRIVSLYFEISYSICEGYLWSICEGGPSSSPSCTAWASCCSRLSGKMYGGRRLRFLEPTTINNVRKFEIKVLLLKLSVFFLSFVTGILLQIFIINQFKVFQKFGRTNSLFAWLFLL